MSDESLFNQSYNQIMASQLGSSLQNFQMNGMPERFNWPRVPTGTFAREAFQIVNTVPNWSPVGTFGAADQDLFSAYRAVLTHITFKVSPERQNDLQKLQDGVTAAQNDVTKAISDAKQEYLAQKEIYGDDFPTFAAWLKKADGGASFQTGIDNTNLTLRQAQTLLLQMQQQSMPQSLQRAVDALQTPAGDPNSTNAPAGWMKVADGTGRLQWRPEWTIATTGQDWRASLTNGSAGGFTIEISNADSSTQVTNSWARGNAGYSVPFWGVHAGGSWTRLDEASDDQSVRATIKVESATVVRVTPGVWYDSGFLADVARGEQGAAGTGYVIESGWSRKAEAAGQAGLFGQYGLLPTRVSGLVVVYKPSFSITANKSTFDRVKQKISASAGLRIGPFTFGGSGGSTSDFQHNTESDNTITGSSTSEEPLILGVTVTFPGLNEK
jgi:hypothetical protein